MWCKNVGGGPGDEDGRRPPAIDKGKAVADPPKKKRKRQSAEQQMLSAIAQASEDAEHGGRRGTLRI